MATLKAGSTVGGVAILLELKPENLDVSGNIGDYLGTDKAGDRKWLDPGYSPPNGFGLSNGWSLGNNPAPAININTWPFTAPFVTATDSGNTVYPVASQTGEASSETYGYTFGGPIQSPTDDAITRFPFSAPFVSSTDMGTLSLPGWVDTNGCSGPLKGYAVAGHTSPPSLAIKQVDSFPFAASSIPASTDVGDLGISTEFGATASNDLDGYIAGGIGSPPADPGVSPIGRSNYCWSFPFAGPFVTATDEGDVQQKSGSAGHSSSTDGFQSGGSSPVVNSIIKYPFAAPFGSTTDMGDMLNTTSSHGGGGSDTHGWMNGGLTPGFIRTIQKFPYASPTTGCSDEGDLRPGAGSNYHGACWN